MKLNPSASSEKLIADVKTLILEFCKAEDASVVFHAAEVEAARFAEDALFITWRVAPEAIKAAGALLPQLEAALSRASGGRRATIVMTSHRDRSGGQNRGASGRGGHRPFALASNTADQETTGPSIVSRLGIIIAVASGKGGVGKSTTAINIAVGLAQKGLRVGILDADIYGPSLPRMLGHLGKPEIRDGKIVPIEAWGVYAISIGFLVDESQAMIWRGPMVMGAINQFINDVAWPALDILIVDLPPGTGDAQLSIAQKLPLSGAVIVSTPQDIALLDARRGVTMFQQLRVPLLGLVENMSYFSCPNCHHRTELFNHGGARLEAEKSDIPFLGEVPLRLDIRESGDAGRPIIVADPSSVAAQCYRDIAEAIYAQITP